MNVGNMNTLTAGGFSTKCQLAYQKLTHTNKTTIRSNLGYCIYPKDTSSRRVEESGIETSLLFKKSSLEVVKNELLKSENS